jgi:hypothetical protein
MFRQPAAGRSSARATVAYDFGEQGATGLVAESRADPQRNEERGRCQQDHEDHNSLGVHGCGLSDEGK